MTVLDLLWIAAAYGAVTFVALSLLAVPRPRALTAGAWTAVLALVGVAIPAALFGMGCDPGENLSAAHAQVCQELGRPWTASSLVVLASPIVSTALMIGGVTWLSRGRPGDGMVAVSVIAAPAVPLLCLLTMSGTLV